MNLFAQCIVACVIFTVLILPSIYKNPIAHIMSYPTVIRKRVEILYKDSIQKTEKKHIIKKILAFFVFSFLFAVVSYFSGARTFLTAFWHTFIIFFAVNIYDLIVLDIGIFCHSKKLIIPGTEDMLAEYRSPYHHIKGAGIGGLIPR